MFSQRLRRWSDLSLTASDKVSDKPGDMSDKVGDMGDIMADIVTIAARLKAGGIIMQSPSAKDQTLALSLNL